MVCARSSQKLGQKRLFEGDEKKIINENCCVHTLYFFRFGYDRAKLGPGPVFMVDVFKKALFF